MKKDQLRGHAYAVIPEMALYGEVDGSMIGDRAVRLFAVLSRFVGANDNAWPSRAALAEKCGGCSVDSVDRALTELVALGAVTIERRKRADGSFTSSIYRLWPATLESTEPQPCGYLASPTPSPGLTGAETRNGSNHSEVTTTKTHLPIKTADDFDSWFERLWKLYPRRVDKVKAKRVLHSALRSKRLDRDIAWQAVTNYSVVTFDRDASKIMHPSTFFGPDQRWLDYVNGSPELIIQRPTSGTALTELVEVVWRELQAVFGGGDPQTVTMKHMLELQTISTYRRMPERDVREIIKQSIMGGHL